MPIKVYRKATPTQPPVTAPTKPVRAFSLFNKQAILPASLITIGSMLLANVVWPIVSYQLFISPISSAKEEVYLSAAPVQTQTAPPATIAKPVETQQRESGPIVIEEELEYINLSQWFPWKEIPQVDEEKAEQYSISIPSLNISNAMVNIGGLNLDKSLIQYPGTANPGELGSPVIFGHSVSQLFYNPSESNPRRYISIFTKIMQLKKDDKIIVTYDGITYTYRVTNKMEVKPDDTYILSQRHDTKELKLITCHPAGTYLKRAIVFAQLESMQ